MRRLTNLLLVLWVALGLAACSGFSKMDYTSLTTRAAWQRPDLVIDALDVQPGDHVVDLGSGEGYFLSYLVEAVGPEGRVTAVDVDDEVTDARLERLARDVMAQIEAIRKTRLDVVRREKKVRTIHKRETRYRRNYRICSGRGSG